MGCFKSKTVNKEKTILETEVHPCNQHRESSTPGVCSGSSKKVEIYLHVLSSSCRAVMMTCAAIDLRYVAKIIDLFKGDHLKPEFVKMNPVHTIPLVDDNGFILWQSRAIMVHILRKYAPDSDIYPKDLKQRSLVDMWLYYDVGTLYKAVSDYVYPQWLRGSPPNEEHEKLVHACLDCMNTCLENKTYLVGETLTLADISTSSSISFLLVLDDYDWSRWRNVWAWWERIKELPYFDRVYRGFFAFKKARPAAGLTASGAPEPPTDDSGDKTEPGEIRPGLAKTVELVAVKSCSQPGESPLQNVETPKEINRSSKENAQSTQSSKTEAIL